MSKNGAARKQVDKRRAGVGDNVPVNPEEAAGALFHDRRKTANGKGKKVK